MRHWEELARFEREGFDVVVEKTWEDMSLRDSFDDTCYDIENMAWKVEHGDLDWFMLRVRVELRGRELAVEYLGGCLYEDPKEVLHDGTVEDMLCEVIPEAHKEATILQGLLSDLLARHVDVTV